MLAKQCRKNMGLLMAGMFEMPNNKEMACSGQMDAMTETMCFGEAIIMELAENQDTDVPPHPPKATQNLHVTVPWELYPDQQQSKQVRLLGSRTLPLHPKGHPPRDIIVERPPQRLPSQGASSWSPHLSF